MQTQPEGRERGKEGTNTGILTPTIHTCPLSCNYEKVENCKKVVLVFQTFGLLSRKVGYCEKVGRNWRNHFGVYWTAADKNKFGSRSVAQALPMVEEARWDSSISTLTAEISRSRRRMFCGFVTLKMNYTSDWCTCLWGKWRRSFKKKYWDKTYR